MTQKNKIMKQNDQSIEQFAELLRKSRVDPVFFAKIFLNFQPFSYQEDFLRDQSNLIAACCGRQTGKSTLAAINALYFALQNNNARVLIVSAGLRQSMLLFDKILSFIQNCLPARLLCTYATRTKVCFENGSEIVALPCGREGSTLRGFTADLLIIDEANFIPRVVIDSVLRPTTITRPNAKLIMMSTPWGTNHPFHEAFTQPEQGFSTYTWPTSMNPHVSAERLELEKKTIGEYDFDREYNANCVDDQFAYFPSNLVLDCTEEYELNSDPAPSQKYAGAYYVGIDLGKHHDHTAVGILQKISNANIQLVYMTELPLNTEYTQVIARVRKLNEAYHFCGGNIDQSGVGEGIYDHIKPFTSRIQGLTLTAQTKERCMGDLRLAMEQHLIRLPRSNKALLNQITSQQCKPLPSGNLQFTHPSGAHDDQLWALALALQAALKGDMQKPIFRSGTS